MNVLIFILYMCCYCDAAPDWETKGLYTQLLPLLVHKSQVFVACFDSHWKKCYTLK